MIKDNTMEQRLLEAEATADRFRRALTGSATTITDLEARLAERATCPGTQAVEELTRMRAELAQMRVCGAGRETEIERLTGLAKLAAREAVHVEDRAREQRETPSIDQQDLEDLRALATQVVEAWDRSDRKRMEQAVAMFRKLSDADDPPSVEVFEPRSPRPLPPVSRGEHVRRYVEAMAPTVEVQQ